MTVMQRGARPDRWRLSRRVRSACGPATKFSTVERDLAEWIESGGNAAPATRTTVEAYLAGYLHAAAGAGRGWGRLTGIAAGLVGGLVAFLVVLVVR
jgi:hypothetical protein